MLSGQKADLPRQLTSTAMCLALKTVPTILNLLTWMQVLTLFIDEDDEFPGPVLELFVDDLEKARETLEASRCQVLRWRGKGGDCYIQDPFGVIFNIWEE